MIKFTAHVDKFIKPADLAQKVAEAKKLLPKIKSDPMAGWLDLPVDYDKEEFVRIKEAAKKINSDSRYLVCIGIGGPYLGHKAVIEALKPTSSTKILYAGNSFSSIELKETLAEVGNADFSVYVASKSGTTTETTIAFRFFKQALIKKYGETKAHERIYVTTDKTNGALRDETVANGYEMFIFPDGVGGRFSVLAPVGLLSIATAGINIDELMQGAISERKELLSKDGGPAAAYAATRNCLNNQGFSTEILACFEPSFRFFGEWWKQLSGESEGKSGKGIFPASVTYSTDLHSLGQFIQGGPHHLFETILRFNHLQNGLKIPTEATDLDELGYLEGQDLSDINQKVLEATIKAHSGGGVPVLQLEAPDISAKSLGALLYFFELTTAFSASLFDVNPFDQPDVEAYKTEMFKLLGKPGY